MFIAHATAPRSTPGTSLSPEHRELLARLVAHFGEDQRSRLEPGFARVTQRWTSADGDDAALEEFCRHHYVADARQQRALLDRLEKAFEDIHGHLYELHRSLRWWTDVREEDVKALDDVLATFDPAPDLAEQLYRQKLAFVALLNLDRPDLATMLRDGAEWGVERWAEARIAQSMGPRIPSDLNDLSRGVLHEAQRFVSGFHIPVGGLLDERGQRVMADSDRALLAHWLLREEIKSRYSDEQGCFAQRALARVMGRHIDGTVPRALMSRETGDGRSGPAAESPWDVFANTLGGTPVREVVGTARYEHLLAHRDLAFRFDAHHPEHPTAMARKFELHREVPEPEVVRLMTALLDSPVRRELAEFVRGRLGRPLEPFDIYYDEIAEPRPAAELNAAVRRRFGDEKALEAMLPTLLSELGFSRTDAEFLGRNIKVQISRGSGHAMRPALAEYPSWMRTSRLEHELGWDGFDTAMHELGHAVEQVISCHFVARPSLRGVPNTACTEAFAFLYQSLARRVLGLQDAAETRRGFAIDTVRTMLTACQIAGPSLLEIRLWHWLYENPKADAEATRQTTLAIADELWERFYRRDFGPDRNHLLAAYQHMINHPLYLADYTLGHVISHQIRSHLRTRDLASETRRICSIGQVTPDLWMRRAVGAPISAEVLAQDASEAVGFLSARGSENRDSARELVPRSGREVL
jgi:hypothetical protein